MFSKAIRVDPRSYLDLQELCLRIRGNGTLEAVAICHHLLRLRPQDPRAHFNLGLCLLTVGRPDEAVRWFQQAIAISAGIAEFHHHLGVALQALGQHSEAIEAYGRAIEISPQFRDPYLPLAVLLLRRGEKGPGIECLRRAYEVCPERAWGRLQLARVHIETGDLDEAERCLRPLTQLEESSVEARVLLGNVLQRLGRFEEACILFEEVLAAEPEREEAALGLIYSRRLSEDDRSLLCGISDRLNTPHAGSSRRRSLHFALGKAFDDLGDYERAIRHFDEANRVAIQELELAGRQFDREAHAADVDLMIRTFTREFFASRCSEGSQSDLPVFIVGMPRSGTTLVEQILSSHPAVEAAGELAFWHDHGNRLVSAGGRFHEPGKAMDLAERYVAGLRLFGPSALRVTDKLPNNYLRLGLICWALPNARIIHCRRAPIDNCLSIYMTPFRDSLNFGHDRENILFFYRQYQRIMEHWRHLLSPDRFLEVDYEQLVEDPMATTASMIAFCHLDWDDACLRHESNPHAVTTPSMWQVRQPIYKSSVEKWRNYEPWLGVLASLRESPGHVPRSL
jgi:tetratricopeptide (TPR) repeat protein